MGCSASRKEVGVYELIVTGAGELSGRYVQLSGKHMYKDKPWWHKDGRFNEDHGRQVWWNKGEWRVGSTSDHWWANKNPAQPPTSGEWPGWHQKNARGGPYPHFAIAVRERIGAGVMSTEDKESPPDQPKFTRSRSGLGWVYTESGTQKRCKHCGQARPRSMFVGKQWKKPRPTCVDCAAKLSAQNATAEQPPPPPPARRWFSRAEPEPSAPKFEEMYNQIAAWYKQPENAALRARWGAYPDPEELQTWPGFVRVTNAFLDATVLDGEAVTSPGNVVVDAEPVSPSISFWAARPMEVD